MKYSRVFNDALSVVGKPNGLRATEWSFDGFCGQTSTNGAVYGATPGVAADLAGKVIGDTGGLIMARLITPPGSRDNTLFIDGQLRGYNVGSLTELVVICIYEELVTMDFAPPQELPLSTSRVHVINFNEHNLRATCFRCINAHLNRTQYLIDETVRQNVPAT